MPESVPVLGVPVGTTGSTSVTGATPGAVRSGMTWTSVLVIGSPLETGNCSVSVTFTARGGPVEAALLGSLFHSLSQPPLPSAYWTSKPTTSSAMV